MGFGKIGWRRKNIELATDKKKRSSPVQRLRAILIETSREEPQSIEPGVVDLRVISITVQGR